MGMLNGKNGYIEWEEWAYWWELGILGWDIGWEDIHGHTERLEGLGLGLIRKLVSDGRETLFLAFLERFQCRNSCTAHLLVM
jgi:hypothetical protein